MPNERENFYQPLTVSEYNIAGNVLRAYYDMDHKLVFVLDMTVDETKPNVLLVINPDGDRKWDDILMNEYGVDLETVRPKKDNKYQKLDIEYAGLAAYDALISVHNAGADTSDALVALREFRHGAAMRAALERLAAAELTAERARETIDKADETVGQLQTKLKTLRTKLTAQRREIGREPTKQSAAKILRTESQIDATGDKLDRAKKRLSNAHKRLAAAVDDADAAREILNALGIDDANVPAMPAPTSLATVKSAPVPMENVPQFTEIVPYDEGVDDDDEELEEPQVDDMDEEVKPLFDEDPNVLDENIAFKPVDFGGSTPVVPVEKSDNVAPLTFTPPVIEEEIDEDFVAPVPVLDTLTSVDTSDAKIDSELLATNVPTDMPVPIENEELHVAPVVQDTPQPMPEISPAPLDSGFRPVSPIASEPVTEVTDGASSHAKPTVLYYVMLIALIVLSIFTLWMYQRSANDNLPELGAKSVVEPVVEVEQVTEPGAPSPFIEDAMVVDTSVAEPFAVEADLDESDVLPLPSEVMIAEEIPLETVPVVPEANVPVAEAVQEVIEMADVPVVPVEPVAVEPEPQSPFISDEVVEPVIISPVPDATVNKPEYSVSPQEKPVVAEPEYDVVAEPVVQYDTVPVVQYNTEPEYYNYEEPEPTYEPEYYAQETFVETSGGCAGGGAPDADGCCPGENLMDAGGGQYLCCDESTGDCFDPMN